jgi:hypothetical protein
MPVANEKVEELDTLCVHLLSPHAALRRDAEQAFLKWKDESLDSLFLSFRQLFRSSPLVYIRSACMVLLMEIVLREEEWVCATNTTT